MALLHLLRHSAFSTNEIENCLQNIKASDSIVLMDDACYNVNHQFFKILLKACKKPVYVIDKHINARGLVIPEGAQLISMKQLTQLVFEHNSVITW